MWCLCPLWGRDGGLMALPFIFLFFLGCELLFLNCLLKFPPHERGLVQGMRFWRETIALGLYSMFHSESSSFWFMTFYFYYYYFPCESTTSLKFVWRSMNWSWSKKHGSLQRCCCLIGVFFSWMIPFIGSRRTCYMMRLLGLFSYKDLAKLQYIYIYIWESTSQRKTFGFLFSFLLCHSKDFMVSCASFSVNFVWLSN